MLKKKDSFYFFVLAEKLINKFILKNTIENI